MESAPTVRVTPAKPNLVVSAQPLVAAPVTPTTARSVTIRSASVTLTVQEYPVPPGSRPHDVAPAADGGV